MTTMAKTRTVKVPNDLLQELVGCAHKMATDWYEHEDLNRATNNHSIADNCRRYGDEKAAIANQGRRLLDIPPMEYRPT
jgi:hypothetical protein